MSKSNSELISWFQKFKQNLQLEEDKAKLKTFKDRLAKRRERLEEKFSVEHKEQKSMNKSIEEA